MPNYAYVCDSCGFRDEVYIKLIDFETSFVECPYCVLNMRRMISPVATIGPMPSKPLVLDSIGKRFDRIEDLREYQKQNGDLEMHSATDQSWLKIKDRIREKAETQAVGQGFKDLDDMKGKKAKINKQKTA